MSVTLGLLRNLEIGVSRPYTIVTPDFQITSGGIRVMWGLYGWLLSKGQQAYINGMQGDDFIAVYPEIYHDNPANSKHVVRYVLNTPGVMATNGVPGPVTFPKEDKIYVFSELYNDDLKVDKDHIMFLPILDLHTFKITNTGKRTKKCKLIGKGSDFHLPETEGLFELTREFSNNQQALADYLNECKVMYSYDPNSAMFEVARLCGCEVVIIPSIYKLEDYEKYEPGTNGISLINDRHNGFDAGEFRTHYKSLITEFDYKLDKFIAETQAMK